MPKKQLSEQLAMRLDPPKKKKETSLFKVSQSKAAAFLLCKMKYHLKHVEQLEKKRKARPLKFGDMAHKMIEAQAEGKDPIKKLDEMAAAPENRKLFKEEIELYGDIVGDMKYIMTEYFKFWGEKANAEKALKYISVNDRRSEHKFELELVPGEILAKGKIDAFASAKKMKWLVEHKTHKNFPNDDHRWRNMQSVLYIRINEMLDWMKVDGTVWDYIRSKSPTRPMILKDGGMSQKSADTLPSVVLDVLKENKLSAKDYAAFIKLQEENRSSYFQRIFTPTKKKVADALMKDFIATSREMADAHGKIKTRTIGRHCDWCEFEPICRAALTGGDVDYVIEHEYTESTYESETEEEGVE